MGCLTQNARDVVRDLSGDHPDSLNQLPGEELFDQELRLLAFPHHKILPVRRRDCVPIQHFQLSDVIEEWSIASSCVAVGERPTATLRLSPFDYFSQIRLEMHNRALASRVLQIRVVTFVEQEEHNRPGAEVERNVFSDPGPGMAVHLKLLKPTPLDLAHSDHRPIHVLANALRIRPHNAIDNLRQIIKMCNVIVDASRRDVVTWIVTQPVAAIARTLVLA